MCGWLCLHFVNAGGLYAETAVQRSLNNCLATLGPYSAEYVVGVIAAGEIYMMTSTFVLQFLVLANRERLMVAPHLNREPHRPVGRERSTLPASAAAHRTHVWAASAAGQAGECVSVYTARLMITAWCNI